MKKFRKGESTLEEINQSIEQVKIFISEKYYIQKSELLKIKKNCIGKECIYRNGNYTFSTKFKSEFKD